MLSLERQQAILEYIRQHHSAKVSELSSAQRSAAFC